MFLTPRLFTISAAVLVLTACDRNNRDTRREDQKAQVAALLEEFQRHFAEARYPEASTISQKALVLAEKSGDPKSRAVAALAAGMVHLNLEEWGKAEAHLKGALTLCKRHFGPKAPETGAVLRYVGELFVATSRPAEAEPLLRRALEIVESSFGPDHPRAGIINQRTRCIAARHQSSRRSRTAHAARTGDQ